MGLPHTIIGLLNRANVTGNERQELEHRIYSILHNAYEKGRKAGEEEGYEKGLDDAFEVARDQSELIDEAIDHREAKKPDWAEGT